MKTKRTRLAYVSHKLHQESRLTRISSNDAQRQNLMKSLRKFKNCLTNYKKSLFETNRIVSLVIQVSTDLAD